ncbi:uncharacterized protein [Euwallacea similis]|uniref:uncharacterized protein n=1 Tax=Euwallacea similis TaxID=1736056 RepID=UPI00345073FE
MIITQITVFYQNIYDILSNIEEAITFAKLNTFHNTIIDPSEFLTELQSMKEQIPLGKLPFEPNIENLLTIENTLEIKSFAKDNSITFIIEIPLVEKVSYDLFRLLPLPVRHGEVYKVIIPRSEYLLINDQTFGYANEPCRYVSPNEYLCPQIHIDNFHDFSPCEVQLLRYEHNATRCKTITVTLGETQIQNIDDNKWILVTTKSIVGLETCKSSQSNILLDGTYAIDLEYRCNLKIRNIVLRGNRKTNRQFQIFPLLDININHTYQKPYKKIELPNLSKIDLNNIAELQNEVDLQKKENSMLLNTNLHYDRTSLLAKYLWPIVLKYKKTEGPENDIVI